MCRIRFLLLCIRHETAFYRLPIAATLVRSYLDPWTRPTTNTSANNFMNTVRRSGSDRSDVIRRNVCGFRMTNKKTRSAADKRRKLNQFRQVNKLVYAAPSKRLWINRTSAAIKVAQKQQEKKKRNIIGGNDFPWRT